MNSKTIHGVTSRSSLESLQPIFQKWNQLIDTYSEVVRDDVPFGAGRERSIVGILHAAALMNEPWQGLQEFSQLKETGDGSSMGRPDLWLFHPKGPDGQSESFYFEAKGTWTTVGAASECRAKWTDDCLNAAKFDAKCVRAFRNENPRFIALALIYYKGEMKMPVSEIEGFAKQAQGYVEDQSAERLVSWVFPEAARKKASGYVGIVALAEEVDSNTERI